mmetsp:Transcript_1313/g.2191  ORF Transcript_1313/g.2191 Transcript_1313/m.2191 type:complete len:205 (+) Transcript_1313:237-851(+)
MPTVQEREGVYERSFQVVSSYLWDKHEGHGWIKEVEVLNRFIDPEGRLHSRRLLTLHSRFPMILRPILGNGPRPFYLLEDVVVDIDNREMEVRTRNVNLNTICESCSTSSYVPHKTNNNWTQYHLTVETRAFPPKSSGAEDPEAPPPKNRWGALNRQIETFVGGLVLGNVQAGEKKINDWVRRLQERCDLCRTGRVWLCQQLNH